jgi:hypothetical protein
MSGFNWKLLVVPIVPTFSIIHTKWLCYVANQPWPSEAAMGLK